MAEEDGGTGGFWPGTADLGSGRNLWAQAGARGPFILLHIRASRKLSICLSEESRQGAVVSPCVSIQLSTSVAFARLAVAIRRRLFLTATGTGAISPPGGGSAM